MSNDIQKADQIAYRLFTKLTLVVNQARSTLDPPPSARAQTKVDKWFNLETPDSDIFRDHLRIYRSVSSAPPPPPFELQVLLSIPELTSNQVLVYQAPDSSRVRIEPTPRHILLETWLLVFTPTPSSSSSRQPQYTSGYEDGESSSATSSGEIVAPSTIYKHGIPLFRSLFSLLRILPAWKLFKRLRRRTGGGNRNANLGIMLRVRGVDDGGGGQGEGVGAGVAHGGDDNIMGFDTPPSLTTHPLPSSTHVFPSVPHPMGTLSLTTQYLSTPNFHLDELESLLSSRFLSLDEGPEFTPTLASKQQLRGGGDGGNGGTSPLGSLPIRTSLPKSPPPSSTSIADRFILPSQGSGSGPLSLHSRTTSLPPPPPLPLHSSSSKSSNSNSNSNPGSPRGTNVPLPVVRTATTGAGTGTGTPAGSGSGISVGSSSRGHEATGTSSAWSKDDGTGSAGGGGGGGTSTGTGKQVSGIAARLRKESTGAGRGADLPSSPGPLPIRRPNINPVHPFKASTLSSGGSPSLHSPSPSLRQPSPLSSASTGGGRPLPSAGAGPTSPTTTTTTVVGVGVGGSGRVPPSPIGMGSRPSPPQFAPSSLGDRRSLASAEGGDESSSPKMQGQGRKRYSSSFSKRYSATGGGGGGMGGGGAGSEGSAGSAERERNDSERLAGGGSFLSNNTDDDDISVFVQEIDARKPLSGHQRIRSHDRDTSDPGRRLGGGGEDKPIAGLLSTEEGSGPGASSSSTGPMLTSESEVDERLRQMNQAFLESLEGLGGGRRRERRSPSRLGGGEGDDGSERSSEPDPPLGRMSTEGSGSRDSGASGSGSGGGIMGRGRGLVLPPVRPRLHSRSTSTSDVGGVQGSDEVLGRLSLDDERRGSRG